MHNTYENLSTQKISIKVSDFLDKNTQSNGVKVLRIRSYHGIVWRNVSMVDEMFTSIHYGQLCKVFFYSF
jgi:hypothetical protein